MFSNFCFVIDGIGWWLSSFFSYILTFHCGIQTRIEIIHALYSRSSGKFSCWKWSQVLSSWLANVYYLRKNICKSVKVISHTIFCSFQTIACIGWLNKFYPIFQTCKQELMSSLIRQTKLNSNFAKINFEWLNFKN